MNESHKENFELMQMAGRNNGAHTSVYKFGNTENQNYFARGV